MQSPEKLLLYAQQAVSELLKTGAFLGGQEFRISQEEALASYERILFNNELSPSEKLRRFFEMPTGVGKTAVFAGLIGKMTEIAAREDVQLKSMVVVPTILLLYQIKDEITAFAPNLKEKIGLYGDTRKDKSKPVTVITYDSWVELIERGELSGKYVDILISDEAHKGTSEKRVTHMEDHFSDGVLSLGFTATARYDEEKTIELTHGAAAYERAFADAVRDGELAAYIQTMLYVIRVLPPTPEQEFNARAQGIPQFRSDLKKAAWSQRIVAIMRDIADPQTGDPLSDNQSGIYCAGTKHVDYTAALLNADPVLNEKARSMGMKGVAVPVHSGIPRRIRRRNWEEYTSGEWLMVVSDDELKEGMNYPPMKNLVDYHHHSLVLKAQILGRASRQWLNHLRMRYEGTNIIDTVTYIGDPDPWKNRASRKTALRKAVLAWDVIGGTHVLSKAYEAQRAAQKKPVQRRNQFLETVSIMGQEVEAYIDLESLEKIRAYRDKLIVDPESYIPCTAEMKEYLRQQEKRTGVPLSSLRRIVRDSDPDNLKNWPEGLQSDVYRRNIGGSLQKIQKTHWGFLKNLYQALPDRVVLDVIEISEEIIGQFRQEIERTGVSGTALSRMFEAEMPEGLSVHMHHSWRSGGSKRAQKAHIEWFLAKWRSLPDQFMIPVTDEMRSHLRYHRDRTGVSLEDLIKESSGVPEGLTKQIYLSCMSHPTKGVRRDYYSWMIESWERIPDAWAAKVRYSKLQPGGS